MKGAFGHTATREPLIKRILRKPALPTLLLAPVIAASLFAPSAAFAAEDSLSSQADTVPEGVLVLCDDPFSLDYGSSNSAASVPVGEIAFDSASTSANEPQTQDAIPMIADPEPAYKEVAPEKPAPSVSPVQETAIPTSTVTTAPKTESVINVAPSVVSVASQNPIATSATDTQGLLARSLANAPALKAMGNSSGIGAASSIPVDSPSDTTSGSVEFYEPRSATLNFSAGEGGYVAKDEKSELTTLIVENFPNSLKGTSTGATAFAKDGFHFMYWLDTSTKRILSKNPTYTPYRPDGGWPDQWTIQAVFEQDVYDIVLDPNGGSGGGGGGSSGVVRLEGVVLGSNYELPLNGGSTVAFEKAGSLFTGWDVIAFPSLKGATGSYHLADGQVLDSATENDLMKQGKLVLDWSSGRTPTITLYAQWLAGQIAINYNASNNGSISYNASSNGETTKSATETFDAKSGKHVGTNVYGPKGATAKPDAHYHFDSWQASGSEIQMTEAEARAARLEGSTVERLSHEDASAEYTPMTFTATFAPNTYVIKYNANGGSGSVDSQSLTYGASLTAPNSGYEREGYALRGWNTSALGTGTQISLGGGINANTLDALFKAGVLADSDNASSTLYAQWQWLGGTDPDPEPEPEPAPNPEPEPTPTPQPNPNDHSNISDEASSAIDDYIYPVDWSIADRGTEVSEVAANVEDLAKDALKAIGKEEPGLLASSKSGSSSEGTLVARTESGSSSAVGGSDSGNFLDQLMTPQGMQQAGTTVAAVAAVGALMGLVGVGASVAGAAVFGAATIGAAGAMGLTSAADLAADLAAVGAGAGAGAAAKRRRKDDEETDDESEEEDED